MGLQWHLLEQNEHPTLEAILQISRVLDQLGNEKPETQVEADRRLQYAAKQASTIGKRDTGDLKVDSLLKKVERLDKGLGTNLIEAFREWQDKDVTGLWPKSDGSRLRFQRERQALFNIAEAYQRAILVREAPPAPIELSILTTRLLEERFWPTVIQRFYEEMANSDHPNVYVGLSTIEPYAILDLAADDETHDLLVTYALKDKIREIMKDKRFTSKSADLHRCLIGYAGRFDSKSTDEILKSERLAIHPGFGRIMEGVNWPSVLEKARKQDFRSTTLAIHAYCRSGSGVGISHVEFLNDLEQKELDVLELDPKEYGMSALVCLRPVLAYPPVGKAEEAKSECISLLERIVHLQLQRTTSDYDDSFSLTKKLAKLSHSYTTASTYLNHPKKDEVYVEGWRGKISLKVTPNFFVHGIAEVFGDQGSQNVMRRTTQRFGLIGRVSLSTSGKHGQMVLRAMNRENKEISMASFVVEESNEGLRCPGMKEACLIGHWIGKEWSDEFIAPNAGIWIMHYDSKLTIERITKLIDDYRKLYPVTILPGLIRHLSGKPDQKRRRG